MKKELKNFLKIADKAIDKLADEIAEKLIDKNPEDYNPTFEDYGYYNNGVGMACCGGEMLFDEDAAREDAIEQIADDVESKQGDYWFDLLENDEFRRALADLIRSL